jgi:ribosomal protein S24E
MSYSCKWNREPIPVLSWRLKFLSLKEKHLREAIECHKNLTKDEVCIFEIQTIQKLRLLAKQNPDLEWLLSWLEMVIDFQYVYTEKQVTDPDYLSGLEKQLSLNKKDTFFRKSFESSLIDIDTCESLVRRHTYYTVDSFASEKLKNLKEELFELHQIESPIVPVEQDNKRLKHQKSRCYALIFREEKRIIDVLKEIDKNPSPEFSRLRENAEKEEYHNSIRQKLYDEVMCMLELKLSEK